MVMDEWMYMYVMTTRHEMVVVRRDDTYRRVGGGDEDYLTLPIRRWWWFCRPPAQVLPPAPLEGRAQGRLLLPLLQSQAEGRLRKGETLFAVSHEVPVFVLVQPACV